MPILKCYIPTAVKACDPTDAHHGSSNGQKAKDVLIPSDNTVSSFLITNPDRPTGTTWPRGPRATGFLIALPEHPTGAFKGTGHQRQHLVFVE